MSRNGAFDRCCSKASKARFETVMLYPLSSWVQGGSAPGRDTVTAADQLGLAIRLDPLLAPAIVDVVAGTTDRRLAFVRGDAYRLLGREREALRSYADAVASPSNTTIAIDATDRTDRATDVESSNHPPEGDSA